MTAAGQHCGRILLIACLLSTLSACQLLNKPDEGKIIVDDLQLQSPNKQDQAISIAINNLEQGNNQQAREVIERVLRVNPQHPTAILLVKLLDVPATQFFKTQRITQYRVKSGDTLGSIAETWLGNSLYFISLAQLNQISKPTRIKPGTQLQIPVIEISPLAQKEKRRSQANLALIKKLNQQNKYYQALKKLNTLFILQRQHPELLALQQLTLRHIATASVSISDRYEMLAAIKKIADSNPRDFLNPQYQQFITLQTHQVLLDEFVLLLDDQSYLESAEKLIEAKSSLARSQKLSELDDRVNLLIDKLHEEAIIYRKNQDLPQAMLRWKTILNIDPNNELAAKYYQRTEKLLTKLKQLN